MIDTEVSRLFDRRSALFFSAGAILTSVLVLRMLQMQVFSYREYKRKSENNSFRIQINMPERGKILSASGTPISRDARVYRIYIVPEETDDLEGLLSIVSADLSLSAKALKRIRTRIKKQQKFQPVLVSENTDWTRLAGLQAKNLPGLHVENGFARVYEMGLPAPRFSDMSAPRTSLWQARRSLPQVLRGWSGGLTTHWPGAPARR